MSDMTSTTQRVYGPAFTTRYDLMGIRYMTDPNPDAGAGTDDAAAQAAAAAGVGVAGENAPWTKENFDPDRAWKLVENLRSDLAATKTSTATAITDAAEKARRDALADLAVALGGGDKVETDPEKLRASLTGLQTSLTEKDTALTEAQGRIKAAELSAQVAIHAGPLGGNAPLLLTNEKFKTSIASVEPTDEAAIKAAITKAIQENAALKAPAPRSGSGNHQGGDVQSLESQLKTAEEKKDQAEIIRLTRAVVHARQQLR